MRARTSAEAYKSEAHKYLTQAPPYDGPDRPARLGARLAELEGITRGHAPDDVSDDEAAKGMPEAWWSIEEYLTRRLDDQIAWYRQRANAHTASVNRGRAIALALGGTAALLGAATGAAAEGTTLAAALLGIVTTAAGSVGAHVQAAQYQAIAAKYRETADALERRRADFATALSPERHQLVADAESLMQAENAAWIAQMTSKTA
jgi:hypothetical protein